MRERLAELGAYLADPSHPIHRLLAARAGRPGWRPAADAYLLGAGAVFYDWQLATAVEEGGAGVERVLRS